MLNSYFVLISLISLFSTDSLELLEIDTNLPTVRCFQCIQLWRSFAKESRAMCGPNSRTCTGNACFMRQCKHCPAYQYMSGCLLISEWQIADLTLAKQRGDLLATRVGAILLCEDSINQTTCICNRKDKCNDIHARSPFSTYTGNILTGIINIDQAINQIDPMYHNQQSKSSFQLRNFLSNQSAIHGHSYIGFSILSCLILLIFHRTFRVRK